jgi:beta-glucosidase
MAQRFVKAFNAGVDQFGGTERVELLIHAARTGEVSLARIDASAKRILSLKFALGLFENPYVDPADADRVVGNPEFVRAALEAQRRSLVLLQNDDQLLPLRAGRAVYLSGIDADAARAQGWQVVDDPQKAAAAVIRLNAPHEDLHPNFFFGSRQHEGNLAFADDNPDYQRFRDLSARLPTVAIVFLDRPAILTNIRDKARAVVGEFGISDSALLDVLSGKARPRGRLPLELPSSMAEVEQQKPDAARDTAHPLYAMGAGLDYP